MNAVTTDWPWMLPVAVVLVAGAVLAVCTSATMSADGVIVAISHAAIVACIV